jgi:2-C-methyl-D-erythritol 4-phosphate cytidylyltransferase
LIVVTGGDSRSASVGLALAEVPAQAEIVAVHDAARPLVTADMVEALIDRLTAEPAATGVIAATPVTDTVTRVVAGDAIAATDDRTELGAAQTPLVFRAAGLRAAHDGDAGAVAAATDDAMLVERRGDMVLVEAVAAPNPKVTTPADLRFAELLLAARA